MISDSKEVKLYIVALRFGERKLWKMTVEDDVLCGYFYNDPFQHILFHLYEKIERKMYGASINTLLSKKRI